MKCWVSLTQLGPPRLCWWGLCWRLLPWQLLRGWWSLEHHGDVPAAAWASGAAEGETLQEPLQPQLFQPGRPFLRESSPFVALHPCWCPSSHFHGISLVPAGDALSSLSRDLAVVLQCPMVVQMQESKPLTGNDPRNAPLCSQRHGRYIHNGE